MSDAQRNALILAGVVLVVVVVLLVVTPTREAIVDEVSAQVDQLLGNSDAVTDRHLDAIDNVIETPEELAAQATAKTGIPCTPREISLAMMGCSEEKARGRAREYVMWTAINDALKLKWYLPGTQSPDLVRLFTYAVRPKAGGGHEVDPDRNGKLGGQRHRRYSSHFNATAEGLGLAKQVLAAWANGETNPVGTAVKFLEPKTQDALHAKDPVKNPTTSADVIASWSKTLGEPVNLPDAGDLLFFG